MEMQAQAHWDFSVARGNAEMAAASDGIHRHTEAAALAVLSEANERISHVEALSDGHSSRLKEELVELRG